MNLNGAAEEKQSASRATGSKQEHYGSPDGYSNLTAFFTNAGGHRFTAQKHERLYLWLGITCE